MNGAPGEHRRRCSKDQQLRGRSEVEKVVRLNLPVAGVKSPRSCYHTRKAHQISATQLPV